MSISVQNVKGFTQKYIHEYIVSCIVLNIEDDSIHMYHVYHVNAEQCLILI